MCIPGYPALVGNRTIRLLVFTLLVGIGIGAGVLIWYVEGRVRALDTTEREVTGEIDRLIAGLTDIPAGQAAYLVPGQPIDRWSERVASNLTQLDAITQALQVRARSVDAQPRLQAMSDGLARLSEIDAAIHHDIEAENTEQATMRVFAESRQAIEALTTSLRHLRDAESNAFLTDREAIVQQSWAALAGGAAAWMIGLVFLVRIPRIRTGEATVSPAAAPSIDAGPQTPTSVAGDLAAAADLCTAISRVTSSDALPALLGRAAGILDASGVIVWLSAGEELFPVTAFGYDARTLTRMGSISLSVDNATTAAWRTGEVRTVAGDETTHGAIIVPMFGPAACIGVLTAEVRHGGETDATNRAIASLLAAQLSTVVAAWPAASATHSKVG